MAVVRPYVLGDSGNFIQVQCMFAELRAHSCFEWLTARRALV